MEKITDLKSGQVGVTKDYCLNSKNDCDPQTREERLIANEYITSSL